MTRHRPHRIVVLSLFLIATVCFLVALVAMVYENVTTDEHSWNASRVYLSWLLAGALLALAGALIREWANRRARNLPGSFLSPEEEKRVVAAIQGVEATTSAEVRIHLDHTSTHPIVESAARVFEQIGMADTELHNGVLVYVDVYNHRLAVIGDTAVHAITGDDYWKDLVTRIENRFSNGEHADGLIEALEKIGDTLREHFPRKDDDVNELPDGISRSTD